MTIKTVSKLDINYTNSPYIFQTNWRYSINGAYYEGVFIYTNLTDYPQLNTNGSSGNLPGNIK